MLRMLSFSHQFSHKTVKSYIIAKEGNKTKISHIKRELQFSKYPLFVGQNSQVWKVKVGSVKLRQDPAQRGQVE